MRRLATIGAALIAAACEREPGSGFHAVYALQGVPDTSGNGDFGWILPQKRLTLHGRPTRGAAQFQSVHRWGANVRVLPDGSVRPDTHTVEARFTRRGDTLTVRWSTGPGAARPGEASEAFVVDSGGALLRTIAARGLNLGPAMLVISRYRRVDGSPPAS